ncbi:deubiquitinating protein VCIP135-like isoform X2 [Cimex lectularius]|nr:deubiquitinating protein VCIP135-like isoform X2 [Cimex lectularius]
MGFSHYHHKLVSPLLSTYGMDKHTGKARSLRQLTGRAGLDCSVFGDRTFRIELRHIDIVGFGKDNAANEYLSETLTALLPYNNNMHSLIPLHADGDGHCLVHAISRAVVGRELFWHPLRIGLKHHFNINLEKYKSLLGNFINNSEWPCIIDECEPDYKPGDGSMVGLRNIHVFGLANLLRRPIILLDSLAGMNASADYAAVFLPGLNPPMACSSKSGQLNPPLCLAWSSAARNHYIPLVPVKELPLPKFPRNFLPKVWGFPQTLLDTYMKFDDQNCVTIGGDGDLAQVYIAKLTYAMDDLFLTRKGVPPAIVADLFHYQYSTKLVSAPKFDLVVEVAAKTLQERRLLRCIACNALCAVPITSHWLRPGGLLYNNAKKMFGFLQEDYEYTFRNYGITMLYDARYDMLVVNKYLSTDPCPFCHESNKLRKIRSDGTVVYENGDKTTFPVSDPKKSSCYCGFKHWWDGQLHEQRPYTISLVLDWKGILKKDNINWFTNESNPNLNSSLYDVAVLLAQKHYPGEPHRELLHQYITNVLIEFTKDLGMQEEDEERMKSTDPEQDDASGSLYRTDEPDSSSGSGYERKFKEDTFDSLEENTSVNSPENRKRHSDLELSEAPSPKTSRYEGSGSPQPSTSRLSPKYNNYC